MKNKRLTIKDLQLELEKIKNSKPSITHQTVTNDHKGNQSIITRFHHAISLPALFVLTNILTYAHKIPIISKIVKLLALWYGRTTIWKILVKLRKGFIILNALIGVLTVFSITGFSVDNLYAGFLAMGQTYFETLVNLIKRLFYWFFDLFDHKIVPKVPGDNTPSIKNIKSVSNKVLYEKTEPYFSLRSIYAPEPEPDPYWWMKKPTVSSNSSSTNWSSWMWYTIFGFLMIGFLYFGYIFITDPSMLWESNPTPPTGETQSGGGSGDPGPSNSKGKSPESATPDITITDARTKTSL
jgi:hypothetical protein